VAGPLSIYYGRFSLPLPEHGHEEQMIPAIYKGSIDDAKKIADGVQLERFSTMWRIMSCK